MKYFRKFYCELVHTSPIDYKIECHGNKHSDPRFPSETQNHAFQTISMSFEKNWTFLRLYFTPNENSRYMSIQTNIDEHSFTFTVDRQGGPTQLYDS